MQINQPHTDQIGHHFPKLQTSFVGLEPALAELKRLLAATPMLTLTGCGGSGKTRLALRLAEDLLVDFPDGVYWIDLVALSDPELLPQIVAGALFLREQPERSFSELLVDYLHSRTALLVLDNCEHLRTACADLLTTLFATGMRAKVLATSREPLAIAGEQVWQVPMLTVPDDHISLSTAALMTFESVRLFRERACLVAPSFALNEQNGQVVAQICRRLDGMPLAIELAAARVNVLTPKQILLRLDDSMRLLTRGVHASQAHHQTLRAALDWSFNLLTAAEQALFVRLSVCAGSFGLDAVEGICAGQGLDRDDLLDLLANLIEKSLVVAVEAANEEMRYRLLVPIRHYAAARLHAAGEDLLWRQRHAVWYLALVQRAEPELIGPAQVFWLERLERELDDLRAALAWYATLSGEPEDGLRLSSALSHFWWARGYLSEGQRWLDTFLQKIAGAAVSPAQVDALNARAQIAQRQSNFVAARACYEHSLALARQIEYDEGVESGLIGLGHILWELGEFGAARAQLEDAVRYVRATQHWHSLGRALNTLGLVCMHQGDGKVARTYLDESFVIFQRSGNRQGMAIALWNLAMLAGQGGDFTRARLLYHEALLMNRELNNRSTIADVLGNLGSIEVALGDFAAAMACFKEAEQIYHELGTIGDTAYISAGRGDVAFYTGDYAEARQRYQEALGLFRQAGNQRLVARSLGRLARIACRGGDLTAATALSAEALLLRRAIGHQAGIIFALDEEYVELALAVGLPVVAARLLGAIETARRSLSRPRSPVETHQLESITARLHAQLANNVLAEAWTEGKAMALEEAAAYALDTLSPIAVARPGPEVRIFALGLTRVYRADRLLTAADWTYAKARELIVYLLCRPNASREQIGLDFWPDASAEQVRKRFSAALAHARNALGRGTDWIILADGRYRINPVRVYWCDVDEFESRLHTARLLLQNGGSPEQAVPLLKEAINLYQGDFAEDFLDSEWCQSRRMALQHTYLDALLTLGKLHVDMGRDDLAVAVYQGALAKDPYLEEAHYEVIRCYTRLNKRSQALRQYEILATALAELDATPAAETQVLVEQLRQGRPPA